MQNRLQIMFILFGLLPVLLNAYYVPGVTPVEYPPGQPIRIKVNSLTSTKTAIPYDYYSLPFCMQGPKRPKTQHENFGEILWGDRLRPSMYQTNTLKNITCKRVCEKQYGKIELRRFRQRIEDGYRVNLVLDNLPVSEVFTQKVQGYRTYLLGFPLGVAERNATSALPAIPKTQLNNHVAMTVKYHRPTDYVAAQKGYRIVGFHAVAYSYKHVDKTCKDNDAENKGWFPRPGNPVILDVPLKDKTKEDKMREYPIVKVTWSYSITWVEDPELAWASRWDPLWASMSTDTRIHWFSVVNSMGVLLFLSGMVAMIFMRTLHKDFNKYNEKDNPDAAQEEAGWKLVHGDVFRPPPYSKYLAVYVGTGCQLLGMGAITLIFALLGFLSPASRGALFTFLLLIYVLLGCYGGYVSARLLKMFHQQSWKNVLLTGTMFPGHVFGVFFIMNLILWGMSASTATPFNTLISLLGLWWFVSIPLVLVGAAFGFKRAVIEPTTQYNNIERNIPQQEWWMRPPMSVLMAGILPFGAAFIELFFILSSLWLNRFYYVFGFLAVGSLILCITCAEITIVMVYFQLCYEDYRWWWRSFFTAGSSGVHLFLYSIFYYFTTLRMRKFWSTVLYFTWMLVLSYTFAVVTGTVGFLSAFFFVRFIYSNIKIE